MISVRLYAYVHYARSIFLILAISIDLITLFVFFVNLN